jgi:hypothetical protein
MAGRFPCSRTSPARTTTTMCGRQRSRNWRAGGRTMPEASFLARAAVANHFSGKSKLLSIDFSAAPTMAPLGPCVDLFGDGSFWAISAPGHTDDDIAYLINGEFAARVRDAK